MGEKKPSKGNRFRLVQRMNSRRPSSEPEVEDVKSSDESIQAVVVTAFLTEQAVVEQSLEGEPQQDEDAALTLKECPIEITTTDLVKANDSVNLQKSIQVWLHDTDALLRSKELSTFLSSSGNVAKHATHTAIHVACLPVTFPWHVVCCTTGMVVGTCTHVITSVVHRPTVGQDTASPSSSSLGWIHAVTHNTVPFVLRVAGKIQDELAATALGLLSPVFGGNDHQNEDHPKSRSPKRHHHAAPCAGESSAEQTSFLDRLRLDFPAGRDVHDDDDDETQGETQDRIQEVSPRSADVTKYLLRVNDLGLALDDDTTIHFIDLSPEYSKEQWTTQALDALVERGLALISSNSETAIDSNRRSDFAVHWKAEGSTEKLLRQSSRDGDWMNHLERQVLIWSGKFKGQGVYQSDVPLFLSRGIVPISPQDLLHLFWDNGRTGEYNKFSLGRSTSLVIEDGLECATADSTRGTKVVKSETQVPFTGFSVVMSTVMHARRLATDGECFIIVSRTLHPGNAGCHTRSKPAGKNEMLWGVNLLRNVPGKPHATDLTSFSQVRSSMVPQFLAHRVGIMAVESCFQSMRSR